MKTQAIIVMGGVGKRFAAVEPKQFVLLRGRALGLYAIDAFEHCPLIDSIIVVAPKNFISQLQQLIELEGFHKVVHLVEGGQTRTDSVSCGLNVIDADTDIVCIHDGVRPLVKRQTIEKAIEQCILCAAVVVGVKVKPTIKRVRTDLIIEETLDRDFLWEAQTPQVFKRDVIVQAYQKKQENVFSDDASLVEGMGVPVKMLEGDYSNVKITTPDDLYIADTFLQEWEV